MEIFKNIKNNKGLKIFILKSVLFITLGVITTVIINLFLRNTILFKKYLVIPSEIFFEFTSIKGIIINACLFGFISIIILMINSKKIFTIKTFKFKNNQILFIILSIFLLFFYYYFKFLINQNQDFFLQMPIFWGIIKLIINILFVFSLAFSVFGWDFIKYFIKNFKKELLFFGVITITFFFLMLLVQNLWSYFSEAVSSILYFVFKLFFDKVTYIPHVSSFTMAEGGGPLLGINNFKAIIGKPCSGIDSFLLFTSLYALIFILDYKRIKKGISIAFFFIGLIGMFFTNVLRVFLLFMVGAFINPKFAVGLFHTNVGWILFIIYFVIFWWIVSRFVYKKETVLKTKKKTKK